MKRTDRQKKEQKVGLAPGTVVYTGSKRDKELFVTVIDYDADHIEEKEIRQIKEAYAYKKTDTVTWININGLNHEQEIEAIGQHYELHPLIIEDLVSVRQRPKMDEMDGYLYFVLKMLYFDDMNALKIEHISFILGPNYVISFQEAEGDVFDPIRERLRNDKSRARSLGADYLLYLLMDAIVDNYFHLIENLGEKIERLEDLLFTGDDSEDITSDIQELKREILKIRKAVHPLREVINKMDKHESVLVQKKTHQYIKDLYDHVVQVSESIEIYREMIWSLMDMYMSVISNKMNEVMKVLTIIATIFIPLTFIAGIYGMNFDNIPELHWKYGYFVLWGIMIVIFALMMYYFRKKRWL